MLYEWFRVLKYDGVDFKDLSINNQEENNNIVSDLKNTEFLYMGQFYPFNNFFIKSVVPNTDTSKIKIEYFDGTIWREAVDVLDGTSVGEKSFSRPGVVQFSPERSKSWQKINDTSETNAPLEMQALKIYDLFWIRLSINNDLSAGSEIGEISYCFSSSDRLTKLDIEINRYLNAFQTGKTDWNRELVTASKMVVQELSNRGLVLNRGQILRFDDVSMATDWKTLELIYFNLGPSYEKKRTEAIASFEKSLNSRHFSFDADLDGYQNEDEVNGKTRTMIR